MKVTMTRALRSFCWYLESISELSKLAEMKSDYCGSYREREREERGVFTLPDPSSVKICLITDVCFLILSEPWTTSQFKFKYLP